MTNTLYYRGRLISNTSTKRCVFSALSPLYWMMPSQSVIRNWKRPIRRLTRPITL